MTHRQWLNVIIICLSMTTLLFLFAHQQLMSNSKLSQDTQVKLRSLLPNHQAPEKLSIEGKLIPEEALSDNWQQGLFSSQVVQGIDLSNSTTVTIWLKSTGQVLLFSLIPASADQTHSRLLRHHDNMLFLLTEQQVTELLQL